LGGWSGRSRFPRARGCGLGRRLGLRHLRSGRHARGLVDCQLAEAAVDGELRAASVTVGAGDVAPLMVVHEGAGEAVARVGGGRVKFRVPFAVPLVNEQFFFEVTIFGGDPGEELAEDALFLGEVAVEAPLIGGDAGNDHLFGLADGAEGIVKTFEEELEVFGIIVIEQDMFVGAHAVGEAIATGYGLARWAGGSG
jgi:hypothetical protein